MLIVADWYERFFVQNSMIAALVVLVTFGLLLLCFLNHPYQNSSSSIKLREMQRLLPIVEAEGDATVQRRRQAYAASSLTS